MMSSRDAGRILQREERRMRKAKKLGIPLPAGWYSGWAKSYPAVRKAWDLHLRKYRDGLFMREVR